jgi:hypothetical protein
MISGVVCEQFDIGQLWSVLRDVLYFVVAIKMLDKVRKMLSYWYLQYELVTCLYVFEPWEKKLLNSIIVVIVALVAYSSYVYLPHYTVSLLAYMNILDSENVLVDYRYTDSRIWIQLWNSKIIWLILWFLLPLMVYCVYYKVLKMDIYVYNSSWPSFSMICV